MRTTIPLLFLVAAACSAPETTETPIARVPVSDLLAPVEDGMAEVAARLCLAAIVADCDWTGAQVERVDVTMELVALYDPPERTLGWIADLRDQQPLDLDTVEQGQDH